MREPIPVQRQIATENLPRQYHGPWATTVDNGVPLYENGTSTTVYADAPRIPPPPMNRKERRAAAARSRRRSKSRAVL